jgi:glucuronyl/N-acetylglucosaminyl transferase EXT1
LFWNYTYFIGFVLVYTLYYIQAVTLSSNPAVLLLNEDVPLLSDEIRFAFSVFRQFPDRLVGFTARSHRWSSADRSLWSYSSRLANLFSMIETSAAFMHRKYTHIYAAQLPRRALKLARELPHCQDILLNMLVAAATRRPPIKVTQRKQPPAAADDGPRQLEEFQDRQVCLNSFAKELGGMPLVHSVLRLDPVLFKDPVSNLRKKYRKIELIK